MAEESTDCNGSPPDKSHTGLRIASIFIILSASLLGALIPILLNTTGKKSPRREFAFLIFKFVGSGVIIATAWMHLLAPAAEALGDPCLEDRLGDYDWAFFIGLFTVLAMAFVEMMATSFGKRLFNKNESAHDLGKTEQGIGHLGHGHGHGAATNPNKPASEGSYHDDPFASDNNAGSRTQTSGGHTNGSYSTDEANSTVVAGEPQPEHHIAHCGAVSAPHKHPSLAGQLTAIMILEFGVIFHSVFIGLVLGTTDELVVLLIVLVFHQFMEGLGLGARLASTTWPGGRRYLPYVLAVAFAISTPVGTAAGIGAETSSASDQMLVNGIFDSISAGILMYTGLVELIAHELIFNPTMKDGPVRMQLLAFACILFGAGVMALLAKWA